MMYTLFAINFIQSMLSYFGLYKYFQCGKMAKTLNEGEVELG